MAKNVKTNKGTIDQPSGEVPQVQGTSGGTDTSQATQEQSEGGKEELQISAGGGSGEQTPGKGSASLDSESKGEAAGKEGSEADDRVTGEPETLKYRKIARSVFEKSPQREVLYFTSDFIPFFEKSDANRHAGSLKNNNVVTVNKE